MSDPLYFKKFNMRSIPIYNKYAESDGKIIVFTGGRGSGKTRLVIDFLYHHRDVPYVVCFSPTESLTSTFKPHIPQVFTHYAYSSNKLKNVLHRQRMLIDKIRDDPKYKDYDPRVILIFDDCMKDKILARDPIISEIFLNGRHFRITVLITMQYVLGILPSLRSNIDYAFMMYDSRKVTLKKLHDNYASVIENYGTFRRIFSSTTQHYRAMVIDFGVKSNTINDCVFWYKSCLHHDFRMCPTSLWKYNDIIYKRRKESEYEQMINDNQEEMNTTKDRNDIVLIHE